MAGRGFPRSRPAFFRHARQVFLLDTGYAGIDEENLYCRVDFIDDPSEWATGDTRLVVSIEAMSPDGGNGNQSMRLEADISQGKLRG